MTYVEPLKSIFYQRCYYKVVPTLCSSGSNSDWPSSQNENLGVKSRQMALDIRQKVFHENVGTMFATVRNVFTRCPKCFHSISFVSFQTSQQQLLPVSFENIACFMSGFSARSTLTSLRLFFISLTSLIFNIRYFLPTFFLLSKQDAKFQVSYWIFERDCIFNKLIKGFVVTLN